MDKASVITRNVFKSSAEDRKKEFTIKWSELINAMEESKQVKNQMTKSEKCAIIDL